MSDMTSHNRKDRDIKTESPRDQKMMSINDDWWNRGLRGLELFMASFHWLVEQFIKSYEMCGYKLDFSPDSLKIIDEYNINEHFRDSPWKKYNHIDAYCSEGFYFGEVLIRHLNGKWVWPSDWRIGLFHFLLALGFPWVVGNIAFKHCKVDINGNLIPVMKIADWRLRRKKGLRYWRPVYDLIQQTGGTKYYFSDRCPECGKRKKGYKYCRRCGAQLY